MADFFKRKAYETLAEWKSVPDGRSALLIEGARRVGKCTVAERENAYEVDFLVVRGKHQ